MRGWENGSIFPKNRRLKHQILMKTKCIKRKKSKSEEVINVRVRWEKGKNESEEEKEKNIIKEKKNCIRKKEQERKSVNFPNKKGVSIVHLLIEKPKKRSSDNPRWCLLFFFCEVVRSFGKGKSGQVKERRKGKKEKRKKEKSQEQIMRKIGGTL